MYLNRLAFKNISRVFVEKGDRGSVPNTGLSEDTLRGIPVYNRAFSATVATPCTQSLKNPRPSTPTLDRCCPTETKITAIQC